MLWEGRKKKTVHKERLKKGWKDTRKKRGGQREGSEGTEEGGWGNANALQVSSEVISDLPSLQKMRLLLATCQ